MSFITLLRTGVGLGGQNERTQDGHDIVFGTNHFGHFLLTVLLLDCLKASGESRVVNISSRAHTFISKFDMTPSKDNQVFHR